MGWKDTIIGGAAFLVALVTAIFQPQTEAFANSIIPDAGYYIVRVVFIFAAFCVVAVSLHSVYVWRKRKTIASLDGKRMMEQSKRFQDEEALDKLRDSGQPIKWNLSADIQPPPFGSQDMPDSDKKSELLFIQRDNDLQLTGIMKRLKPSHMYYVQLAKPYTPLKLAKDTIIGAEKAPYAKFKTDQNGKGNWTICIEIDDLKRHGIIDRFVVWVNDAPKNASVLASDIIPLKLSLEFEESKIQTQEVLDFDREKEDFRNGVATEVRSLLKIFIDPIHHWDISYPSWSSKAEESKAELLGKEDYLVLRALYDAIEERNRYFTWKGGMSSADVDPLNLKCVEAFSRAYGEVTWLRISPDTDSVLSKARQNVGLPA